MKIAERYDILNRAKQKGQAALIELPRVSRKDNPLPRVKAGRLIAEKVKVEIKKEADFFTYAKEHPELCPPVGTEINIQNEYGVKVRLTVKWIGGGLPATLVEMCPILEQPEHLQDSEILRKQLAGAGRPGWIQWPDTHAWHLWQELTRHNATTSQSPGQPKINPSTCQQPSATLGFLEKTPGPGELQRDSTNRQGR
jgi:hypothetical protein